MFKLKKIFILFSTLIIIFSFICVPVFADSIANGGGSFTLSMAISQPNISENFAYVEVVIKEGNSFTSGVYLINAIEKASTSTGVEKSPSIRVTVTNNRIIEFSCSSASFYDYSIFYVNSMGYVWDLGVANSSKVVNDTHSFDIVSIRYYGFAQDEGNTIINKDSYSFEFSYGSDFTAISLLRAILMAMPGEDYIADAITDNADKNAAQIQQNADQNAADIQQNADENTDKLLNGWENDTPVDSGGTGSLEQVESSLISGNQQGATNEISAANDSVLSSLSRLGNSFAATGVLFRRLSNHVPDTNLLIYFSLTIGVVPMIVGMGINGLRASDRRTVQSRREADFKRGYSAGYTKGKGG